MQKFTQFLEELITFQHVPRFHLQPARVAFFLSAWWHMQAIEQWPIFYMSVRRVLLIEEQVDKSSQDPIEAYFEFRQGFIALVQALDISVWELEHLCTWHGQQNSNVSNPGNTNRIACDNLSIQAGSSQIALPPESSQARANHGQHPLVKRESMSLQKGCQDLSRHTYLQWLLAKLGHKVGCRVWIRAADHGKEWNNERLGMLSLPCFPAITDSAFMQIIERIDVLWLLKDEVVAAYEIEQAHTDVSAGLLRLYDLNALFPERDLYLCIVIPQDRLEKVQFELSRPVFQRHGTQQHYELISEELLVQHSEHILRWASSPSVIKSLVSFLAPENEHLPNLCS